MEIQICPEKPVGINVVGVYWSNDGEPDEVCVSIDGQYIGNFWIEYTYGDYGRFCNLFKSSAQHAWANGSHMGRIRT